MYADGTGWSGWSDVAWCRAGGGKVVFVLRGVVVRSGDLWNGVRGFLAVSCTCACVAI